MFSEFTLPYGSSFLTACVPAGNVSGVLKRSSVKALDNETEAVLAALRSPIGCLPLLDCIEKKTKVVILVTDNTRPCPDNRLLPLILSELEQKVSKQDITIIISLGLHSPLNRKEMIEKLGENIVNNYRVMNHDPQQVVRIGITSRGTPVEVNRWIVEADFRISTGFIEPHFFAGFSGGCKSIAPGVSSPAAIHHNHSFEMIDHPLARAGILQGNPVHQDIVEQGRMAGLNFIVNVLLDENKKITHIFAGDPVKAHQKGCEVEKSLAGYRIKHKADITITSNSGAPLDQDLYQTCKGIDNASLMTRDGGIIIVASCCSAGVGPAAFRQLHASSSTPEEILNKIKNTKSKGVEWQNHILARAQVNHDIYLLSELEDEEVKEMKMEPIHSIEEGLEKAFCKLGKHSDVMVIPEGPLVLPLFEI